MKRVFLICMIFVLLLAGCGGETVETTAPPASEPAQTTAPILMETEPLELEPVELDAVNLLSKKSFSSSPSVAVLDERTAAFLTTAYDTSKGITVTSLTVIDLYTDTILAESKLEMALSLPVQSQLNGVLPLYDINGDRWIFFDRKLQEIGGFACEEPGGVFDPEMTTYYYVSAQRLCKMDLTTGETSVMDTELTLPVDAITDYRAEDNVLLLNVHKQYYLTKLCVGAVKADTGELLLLSDEGYKCFFSDSGIVIQGGESATSSDVVRTDLQGGEAVRLTGILPSDSVYRSWCIPMSDYQLSLYYDSRSSYTLSSFLLYRFDGSYASCQMYDLLDGLDPDKIMTLPGGNLLAVDYARRATSIAVICPDMLEFTEDRTPEAYELTMIDAEIPEHYAQQAAPVEVPEELSSVREMADELEQRYDITILLSNQCDPIIAECGFEMQQSDQVGDKEAKLLKGALEDLEKALKLYPEGFFSQFKNEANERGILVLLVENINAGISDDNVDVLGVTYDMGDWYPIAVDVTTGDKESTYCHEIWHAMENKIMDEDPMLFNDVMWAKLNPSDFSYKGIVEGYYYDTEYTYLDSNAGYDSYFVDTYGKTKPQEDRARLMEYIMTSDYTAKHMMKAPVLYEKMEIMINAVRSIFDTEGWENVYWERFHDVTE